MSDTEIPKFKRKQPAYLLAGTRKTAVVQVKVQVSNLARVIFITAPREPIDGTTPQEGEELVVNVANLKPVTY